MICVVVAHPDDEVLWFGGALLQFRQCNVNLTIISLTNCRNVVRAAEFKAVCEVLGARSVMLDFPDGGSKSWSGLPEALDTALKDHQILQSEITCVITHPPHGNERAHPQHLQCFEGVQMWTKFKKIPFGVFSERDFSNFWADKYRMLSEIRDILTYLKLAKICFPSIRNFSKEIRKYRKLRNNIFQFNSYLKFVVDRTGKTELLNLYQSQLAGLKKYASFYNQEEFLYLEDRGVAEHLAKKLRTYFKEK